MSLTILIAGGSGLIGTELSKHLISLGYEVRWLGRGNNNGGTIKHFSWDPAKKQIDVNAFKGVDVVINLAGANVGKGKWTDERKKTLLNSRIDSVQLLSNTIIQQQIPIKKFIQASAIGYYGFESTLPMNEEAPAGKDFLAVLTQQWEEATIPLQQAQIPLVILRIGVVLSNKGGALIEMAKPIKMFAGNYLGSGKQIVPWIHITDQVNIFINAIEDTNFTGTYNCVAQEVITNKELTKKIAQAVKRPAWPLGIPAFVLKILLGEQAQIVLEGYHISPQKLINTGFTHKYPHIKDAMKELFTAT